MAVRSVAASVFSSFPEDHAPAGLRESATILPFPVARYQAPPRLPVDMGPIYRRLIELTFPQPSRNRTCIEAAKHLGCGEDAIWRILGGHTERADARVILACLVLHEHRIGKPFPLCPGLLGHLIEDPQ